MRRVKQIEIKLENGERRILNEADIRKGTRLYYSDIGVGFGMEAVVEIRSLPNERILEDGDIRTPEKV